jgi:hypothetical protein
VPDAAAYLGFDTATNVNIVNATCYVGLDPTTNVNSVVATAHVGVDAVAVVPPLTVDASCFVGVDTPSIYRFAPYVNATAYVGVDTRSDARLRVSFDARTDVGFDSRAWRVDPSGRRRVTAQLLASDAVTVIPNVLDESFGRSFMDEFSGLGTGRCSLPLSDPNYAELQRGRFVRVLVGDIPRFTFKIEGSPEYHQIDVGEESAQFLTVSGRGWGCVWDGFIVRPDGGLGVSHVLDYSYRLFSFASRAFPNVSSWVPPTAAYEYLDGVTYGARVTAIEDPGVDPDDPTDDVVNLYPAPIGFPWPNAIKNGNGFAPTPDYVPTYWIIAGTAGEEDIGFHFFRGGFTLAGEQEVKFAVTGDNLFTLFLNGIPILGEDADSLMWQEWKEVTLTLPAGFYVVAAVVENIAADVTYNPAGLLFNAIAMAVYSGDVETTETLALLSSNDTDWNSHFAVAGAWPGYTPGQILDVCGDEAQALGRMPQYQGGTFGETVDSLGQTYDSIDPDTSTLYIPTFAVRLGSTGADVLDQMFQEGWIDYHFRPDTLSLDIFAQGQMGETPGVTFTTGYDITGLERGETKPYANALFIQYAGGFTEWDDPTEIAAAGSVEEDFLQTDAATAEQAQMLGRVELQRRLAGAQAAVLLSIEPREMAHIPYEGFALGDFIAIPQVDGVGTDTVQVLSVTLEEDDDGWAKWRLECNARWRSPAAEAIGLLRSIGGKTIGSVKDHGMAKD